MARKLLPASPVRCLPIVGLGATLGACLGSLPPATRPAASEDLAAFVADAQPVLAKRCAFPACHGPGRAGLVLFALGRARMPNAAAFPDLQFAPLTAEEASANLDRVLPFVDPDEPERSELLRRGIPVSEGGRGHRGGAAFQGRDEPDYQQLLGWITSEVHP